MDSPIIQNDCFYETYEEEVRQGYESENDDFINEEMCQIFMTPPPIIVNVEIHEESEEEEEEYEHDTFVKKRKQNEVNEYFPKEVENYANKIHILFNTMKNIVSHLNKTVT